MANVVTDVGLGLITALLAASTHKYLSWGTDDTAANVTDTALGTESAEDRTTGSQSQVTTTTADDTYQVTGAITATDTRAIVEHGVHSADDAGSLLGHAVFTVVNLVADDSITFTDKFVLDQA